MKRPRTIMAAAAASGVLLLVVLVITRTDSGLPVYAVMKDSATGNVQSRVRLPSTAEERADALKEIISQEFNGIGLGASRVIGVEIGEGAKTLGTKIFGYYIESAEDGFVLLHWRPEEPASRVFAEPSTDPRMLASQAARQLADTTEMALRGIESFRAKQRTKRKS